MTKTKSFFAVLSVALLLAASDARAAFTYSVAVTTPAGGTTAALATNTTTFGQSNYAIVGQTSPSSLSGDQNINLVQAFQGSSRTVGTDTTTITPVTLAVSVTNAGGTGVFTLSTSIAITRSDTGGAASTGPPTQAFTVTPTQIILGGLTYTLSQAIYIAPTINSTSANAGISAFITERAIPEPASLVMMGTSVLALGGLTVIRRRQS